MNRKVYIPFWSDDNMGWGNFHDWLAQRYDPDRDYNGSLGIKLADEVLARKSLEERESYFRLIQLGAQVISDEGRVQDKTAIPVLERFLEESSKGSNVPSQEKDVIKRYSPFLPQEILDFHGKPIDDLDPWQISQTLRQAQRYARKTIEQ